MTGVRIREHADCPHCLRAMRIWRPGEDAPLAGGMWVCWQCLGYSKLGPSTAVIRPDGWVMQYDLLPFTHQELDAFAPALRSLPRGLIREDILDAKRNEIIWQRLGCPMPPRAVLA